MALANLLMYIGYKITEACVVASCRAMPLKI